MATKRKKKQAKEIRHRTARRKVMTRLRRIMGQLDTNCKVTDFNYWYTVFTHLKTSELDFVNEIISLGQYEDITDDTTEAYKAILMERTLGLTNE